MTTVLLEGWFYTAELVAKKDSKKEKEKEVPLEKALKLERAIVPDCYVKSAIKANVADLCILSNMDRIVGSFFNPIYVAGVVDTSKSGIPFFIERSKIKKLRELIQKEGSNCL